MCSIVIIIDCFFFFAFLPFLLSAAPASPAADGKTGGVKPAASFASTALSYFSFEILLCSKLSAVSLSFFNLYVVVTNFLASLTFIFSSLLKVFIDLFLKVFKIRFAAISRFFSGSSVCSVFGPGLFITCCTAG